MGKFVIAPHMRLQEWVAEEKDYFREEGLDYEFNDIKRNVAAIKTAADLPPEKRSGAYQTFEGGRACDVSSACHWTVNMAASNGHGRLWGEAYSVTPGGIYVPADSDIHEPEDLAGTPITVGFQSGSHYSTIQALEALMPKDDINLHFGGMLFQRLELFLDGEVPAANLFGGPLYFAEQLGYRKVIDTTFMIAAMISDDVTEDDVRKCYRALKRAQGDIDLRLEKYTHYYKNEFPPRFRDELDTRLFGAGERIVFEPYTKEMFDETHQWVEEWNIFEDGKVGRGSYEDSVAASTTASS